MAWLESHQTLAGHPKTRKAARLLGIPRVQVIGHLHCLWWWAIDYAEDGDVSRYDAADLADAAEWEGDPDTFVSALIDCGTGDGAGFLNRGDDGGLAIHDWWDYAGKLIDRRKADRERKRAGKPAQATGNDTESGDLPIYSEHTPQDILQTSGGNPTESVAIPSVTVTNRNQPTEEVGADAPLPPDEPDEPVELSDTERRIVGMVKQVKGMASVADAEIVVHLRDVLAIRGSPLPADVLLAETMKFRDHWNEKRRTRPANEKWRQWRNGMTTWFSRIGDAPRVNGRQDVFDNRPEPAYWKALE